MQDIIQNILGEIKMAEKINSDDGNIIVVLTMQECNVFKSLCEEFLGSYKINLSRNRALTINRILDKIERAKK